MGRNTDGRYIILWETRSQDCKRRNVRDSENSRFTYFSSKPVEGVVNKFYYSYLKDTPSNYKLYIDDLWDRSRLGKLTKDNQWKVWKDCSSGIYKIIMWLFWRERYLRNKRKGDKGIGLSAIWNDNRKYNVFLGGLLRRCLAD